MAPPTKTELLAIASKEEFATAIKAIKPTLSKHSLDKYDITLEIPGLKRNEVKLVPVDEKWVRYFEIERRWIKMYLMNNLYTNMEFTAPKPTTIIKSIVSRTPRLADSGNAANRNKIEKAASQEEWNVIKKHTQDVKIQFRQYVHIRRMNIDHIGSTSHIGNKAKPILDILLSFDSEQQLRWVKNRLLEDLRISKFSGPGHFGVFLLGKKQTNSDDAPVVCHYHLVLKNSNRYEEYMAYKKAFNNKRTRENYTKLKEEIINAEKTAGKLTRKDYYLKKKEFLTSILREQRVK